VSIKSEIQKLSPSALIELFVLDVRPLGGIVHRFHPGKNSLDGDIVWQGNVYKALPIKVDGFHQSSKGKLTRPKITVANTDGVISREIAPYNDLVMAIVTKKATMACFLDASNFPDGVNLEANQNEGLDDEIFFVNRKLSENRESVTFELASPLDAAGIKLPRGVVNRTTCSSVYRSSECGYTGGPVADFMDVLTSNPKKDMCGKRLESCALRFKVLPFAGFPKVEQR